MSDGRSGSVFFCSSLLQLSSRPGWAGTSSEYQEAPARRPVEECTFIKGLNRPVPTPLEAQVKAVFL